MRELKFRAWITDSKFMLVDQTPSTAKNAVFMQYIGLQDKNGVEIYEGDFVQWPSNWLPRKRGRMNCGVVEYKDYSYWLTHVDGGDSYTGAVNLYAGNEIVAEVIGNIYENPELLDGASKTN